MPQELIAKIRSAGSRIRLIIDGDIAAAISTARTESGDDVLIDIDGTYLAADNPIPIDAGGVETHLSDQCVLITEEILPGGYPYGQNGGGHFGSSSGTQPTDR